MILHVTSDLSPNVYCMLVKYVNAATVSWVSNKE